MRTVVAALLVAGSALTAAAPALAQDATRGEAVFKKCMACHRAGPDAKNLVGPVLSGVIGRKAGTYPGFKYSDLNHNASEAGLVWTADNVTTYLADPNAFLKDFLTKAGKADKIVGSTKMVFRLPNEQERKDVVAYLATQK